MYEYSFNFKANYRHSALLHHIKELLGNDQTRSDITNAAIRAACKNKPDWNAVHLKLQALEKIDGIPVPGAMQLRVDDELSEDIKKLQQDIMIQIPTIIRLRTSYFIALLWCSFLEELKARSLNVGTVKPSEAEDISGPQMVQFLVEMILLERTTDKHKIDSIKDIFIKNQDLLKEIRKILNEWENKS